MKKYISIITVFLVAALGYNLYVLDYKIGFFAEENFPILVGLAASLLGLIVSMIYFSFFRLQKNLVQKAA